MKHRHNKLGSPRCVTARVAHGEGSYMERDAAISQYCSEMKAFLKHPANRWRPTHPDALGRYSKALKAMAQRGAVARP